MSVFRNKNHFFAECPGTCVLKGETKHWLSHGSAPHEFSITDGVTLGTQDMGREDVLLNCFRSVCPELSSVEVVFAASLSSSKFHRQSSHTDL